MSDPDPAEEFKKWKDPYQPGTSDPLPFSRPDRSRRSWQRFLLWIGPGVSTIPLGFLIASMTSSEDLGWVLFWAVAIALGIGFGIGDARLRTQAKRDPHLNEGAWVVTFLFCQIIVTPLIWIIAAFGVCAISSL